MSVGQAAAVVVEVKVDGQVIPKEHVISFTVDRDLNQPDMCALVLTNTDHTYSSVKMAAAIEINIGQAATNIYKGQVSGLEPVYAGGQKTRITLRCMNKMADLLRTTQSKTYANMNDQAILNQIVSSAGLTLAFDGPAITYKHVYQHNQNNLEFARTRASRIGCNLWCVDTTLNCKKPDLTSDSGVTLTADQNVSQGHQLRGFKPRLGSGKVVNTVTVKGWNPETKAAITGTATASGSKLGGTGATDAASGFGDNTGNHVDQPIWSTEEANALAAAKLQEASLSYMTGEAEVVGDPVFDLSTVITVTVNTSSAGSSDTFNGKYFVAGISYRHIIGGKGKDGGFVTHLRLQRDAQGGS